MNNSSTNFNTGYPGHPSHTGKPVEELVGLAKRKTCVETGEVGKR